MEEDFRVRYYVYVNSMYEGGLNDGILSFEQWLDIETNLTTVSEQERLGYVRDDVEARIELYMASRNQEHIEDDIVESEEDEELCAREALGKFMSKPAEVISVIECSVCMDKCKNPFTNKCGHVHCLECLFKSIGLCPICRKMFKYSEMIRLFH